MLAEKSFEKTVEAHDRRRVPNDGPVARQTIGTFETLDGASLAATHLVEIGYDPDDVFLALRGHVPVEAMTLTCRLRRASARGALIGAAALAAFAVVRSVGIPTIVTEVLPAAALGATFGLLIAVVHAWAAHRRTAFLALSAIRSALHPTAFAVVVADTGAERARNDLARWWDPDARPLDTRRAA